MLSRVPADQVTGSSKADGGIRHVVRSVLANARESESGASGFG